MKELTKAQRHACYKRALSAITNKHETDSAYICDNLHYALMDLVVGYDKMPFEESKIGELFPEFLERKPEKVFQYGMGWWMKSDKISRINVLTACIEETKPE